MREWLARLIDRFRRDELDRELEQELRFHQAELEQEALRGGAGVVEAQRIARRRLGDAARIREDARAVWSARWLDRLQQDLKFAWRGVRRSPAFSLAVVTTLGLGIGANAAMFGVVDRLLVRPVEQLRDPATAYRIYLRWSSRDRENIDQSMSYGRYLDLRSMTRSFDDFTAFGWPMLAIGTGDETRERQVFAVTASFFGFFDAEPALGRFFTASEDMAPEGAAVAVLSHAFWQREFGGRADVLGRSLHVGDIVVTVIGVAPRRMTLSGLNDLQPPALFIPAATLGKAGGNPDADFYGYAGGWANVLVRRRVDVPAHAAAADLTQAYRRSWEAEGQAASGSARTRSYTVEEAQLRGELAAVRRAAGPNPVRETRIVIWLSIVAITVLLIACSNLANLFVVRELSRRRETALRLALGVGRGGLMTQAVVEALMLAAAGAVAGLLVAQLTTSAVQRLVTMMPTQIEPLDVFADARTVTVVLMLALGIGLVLGLLPGLVPVRRSLSSTLRGAEGGVAGHRMGLRASLLLGQTALSFVLLTGAILFSRSLGAVEALPLGYDLDRVLVATPRFRATPLEEEERAALYERLLDDAQRAPGVHAAAWARTGPILGTLRRALFVPGVDSSRALATATMNAVSPGYFTVMGTRVLSGRAFTAADDAGTPPVAMLSAATAQAIWPGESALGRCVRIGADTVPCATVVGIVEDVVTNMWVRLDGAAQPLHYYLPVQQSNAGDGYILMRMSGDPEAGAEQVRRHLQRVMPGASYVNVQPMQRTMDVYHRPWQLGARIFTAFGALALVVAAIGVYGVISYNMAQRKQELGVRVALGAVRSDIVGLVAGQSLRLAGHGVVVGSILALAAARWIQPLLFEQSAKSVDVFLIVGASILGVALTASAGPALRAARTDPLRAIRGD